MLHEGGVLSALLRIFALLLLLRFDDLQRALSLAFPYSTSSNAVVEPHVWHAVADHMQRKLSGSGSIEVGSGIKDI